MLEGSFLKEDLDNSVLLQYNPVFDSFRIEKPTKHIATKCIGGFCFLNFFAYFFLCFCEFKNFFHIFFRHDLIVSVKSECLM